MKAEETDYSPQDQTQDQYQQQDDTFWDTFQDVRGWREDLTKKWLKRKAKKGEEEPAKTGGEGATGAESAAGAETAETAAAARVGGESAERALEGQVGKTALKGVEKKALAAGERKIATHAAEEGAKQALKTGARVAATEGARFGAEAAAGAATAGLGWILLGIDLVVTGAYYLVKKYWRPLLAVAGAFALIPIIVFSLLSGSTGPALPPTTQAQVEQAELLSALSGNQISSDKVILRVGESEKKRYQRVQAQVDTLLPSRSAELKTRRAKIEALWNQLLAEKTKERRQGVLEKIKKEVHEIDSSLPFADWIARKAEESVGKPSSTYCRLTGASANLGCASFVSGVLYDVGVPQPLSAATIGVWSNSSLSLVVAPLPHPQLGRDLLNSNRTKLQRGDVVWWGNGIRRGKRAYPGAIHNHIGIYVGGGSAVCGDKDTVDNSSKQKKFRCSDVGRSDMVFNGAKRYAP